MINLCIKKCLKHFLRTRAFSKIQGFKGFWNNKKGHYLRICESKYMICFMKYKIRKIWGNTTCYLPYSFITDCGQYARKKQIDGNCVNDYLDTVLKFWGKRKEIIDSMIDDNL